MVDQLVITAVDSADLSKFTFRTGNGPRIHSKRTRAGTRLVENEIYEGVSRVVHQGFPPATCNMEVHFDNPLMASSDPIEQLTTWYKARAGVTFDGRNWVIENIDDTETNYRGSEAVTRRYKIDFKELVA